MALLKAHPLIFLLKESVLKICRGFSFCVVLIVLSNLCATGQIQPPLLPQQSLRFGMDKIGNTIFFKGATDGDFTLPAGSLRLRQNYVNTILRTGNLVVRDNEDMFLRYRLPLDSSFTFISQGNWQLVKNSPSFNLINSERINGAAGVNYKPVDFFSSEFLAGMERNEQSGFKNSGVYLTGAADVINADIEEYFLNAHAQGEYSHLGSLLENSDVISESILRRTFDENNQLLFSVRYQDQARDFLRPTFNDASATLSTVNIEGHILKQLVSSGEVRFSLSDYFKNETTIRLLNGSTINYSKQSPVKRAASQVSFDEDQSELTFGSINYFAFKNFTQSAGFSLMFREEKNRVTKRGDVTQDSLQILQQTEFRTDYASSQTRLFAQSEWTPFKTDTARLNASVSLYKHDTPSSDENSDRDVLSGSAGISYARDISPFLKASLTAQIQATHLVFLKAQLSAQNNWNTIIRLTPVFTIRTRLFSARPEFEIMANYTANDFEKLTGTSRSVSFRQLSYRDSITIPFGEKYYAASQINLRYFERGELRWNEFAEKPQSQRYEQFTKLLIFTKATQNITVGAGGRYYALVHKPYGDATGNSEAAFTQTTAGLESAFTIGFTSGSSLSVNGWYEFQFVNAKLRQAIPNIFLNAVMAL